MAGTGPIILRGKVVKGFGRGSKELGCPTANISPEPYAELLSTMENGVYYGYARIRNAAHVPSKLHQMVMSIGFNPYYQNTEKTIEAHVLDLECDDFYGADLELFLIGYIRPELNFDSLQALKSAIADDCSLTRAVLNEHPMDPVEALGESA